ncbi:MAG TPA: SRPBCC family protein [Allosphingosinicella sp.]|uniref:SRPBCC family protein n=1 Tax=Allosphingosinicella sp. TaxID=2823234 RepID=UPI002EDA9512
MKKIALVVAAALSPASAAAEVKSSSLTHFEVESSATVAATPAEAYAMLGRIGEWWNKDHTYSGDAANLSLELRAGGCFCERLPKENGVIEHLRVVSARPGQLLRLQGGLGPLQAEAVAGTFTWTLKAAPGGTIVTQNYAVAGRVRMGMEKLAPLVDQVLVEQLSGLQKRLSGK